jgi:hypothetical protein
VPLWNHKKKKWNCWLVAELDWSPTGLNWIAWWIEVLQGGGEQKKQDFKEGTMAFTTTQKLSQPISTLEKRWKYRQNPHNPISLCAENLRFCFKIDEMLPFYHSETCMTYPWCSTSTWFLRISRQLNALKQWRLHRWIRHSWIGLLTKTWRCGMNIKSMPPLDVSKKSSFHNFRPLSCRFTLYLDKYQL